VTRTPKIALKSNRSSQKTKASRPLKRSRPAGRDEIRQQPGHLARRLRQIATAVQTEEFGSYGVTPLQFGVMLVLRTSPGIDQVTLAGILAHNQATIGGVVARLSKRGLVVRERGVEDKRSWVLYLTAEGRRVLDKLKRIARRAQNRILDPLTEPERRRFMTLLTKIVDGNKAASRSTIQLADRED
jgi:DNA-binding MarR family transcriptional regulator